MYRVGCFAATCVLEWGVLITRKDEKYLSFMVVIVGSNTL